MVWAVRREPVLGRLAAALAAVAALLAANVSRGVGAERGQAPRLGAVPEALIALR